MTIYELKMMIKDLPEETVILIEDHDVVDVETVIIQLHREGNPHLILSARE